MRPRSKAIFAIVAVIVTLTTLVVVLPPSRTQGLASASTTPETPFVPREYFGDGNPFNVWNSDLSGAQAAFLQMKAEGFNAVALVVPWGKIQTGVTPPRYNSGAFERLRDLVAVAAKVHLQVILRRTINSMSIPMIS